MELHSNTRAEFTKWVVRNGLLTTPFVLVDVGVQGGEAERWQTLGDHLVLHGFDAIEEVVDELKKQNLTNPNKHYHWLAAGDFDGEETIYFNAADPFSSSMYQQGEARFEDTKTVAQARPVTVRRLDTLLAEGVIPRADFLKVDVEGYEKSVFLGAAALLKGVLGFEAETAFTVSDAYPGTHFGTILDVGLRNHQRLFDLEFNRVPRASFQRLLAPEDRPGSPDQVTVGRPATVNVLFCRDLIEEADSALNYPSPPPSFDVDGIIKQAIVYELYGLNDVAVDTLERFSDRIGSRIEVDKAVRLLADPLCRTPGQVTITIHELREDVERLRQLHADDMAAAARLLWAERDEAMARVMELEAGIRELNAQVQWLHRIVAKLPRPVRRMLRRVLERDRGPFIRGAAGDNEFDGRTATTRNGEGAG